MKKILLSAVILLSAISYAQDVKYGAKLGINISSVSGDVENSKSLIGAQIGGFAEISISDKFAIQPELVFSMQGAKTNYSETDVDYSYSDESKTKLNYLNLPILAKYYVADKFALLAGPQFGFLISAKEKYDFSETSMGTTDSGSESIDVKDFYKSLALSFNVGATYSVTEKIFVDARYNLGLSSVAKEFEGEKIDIKNNVIQVSLGYKF